jgi:hypothetical protein
MTTARRGVMFLLISSLAAMTPCRAARAQVDAQPPFVLRGVQALKGQLAAQGTGESALAGLALLKAGTAPDDPAVRTCLQKVMSRFNGTSFTPERAGPGGHSIYEAAVVSLFLSTLDPLAYRPQIDAVASYLAGGQIAAGGWDYPHRTAGDTSISQYAILGLWEAENAGSVVSPRVWDRAARWFLSVQDAAGGWAYHRDDPGAVDTVSMTAAGVGSLLICQRQLARHKQVVESRHPFLVPVLVDPNAPGSYRPETSTSSIAAGVRRGLAWLAPRFDPANPIMGQSSYYGLYGIERIGALADRDQLGGFDWYARGAAYIGGSQQPDGTWNSQHGVVPNTAWAILFSTKSTAQTMRKIQVKRLGSGTLIGGRGLPRDLTSLTVAGGRVLARPMNGAIEGMLAVLEDPRAEGADAAVAGLIARYDVEGPAALRPHRDRFLKLLEDRDPGIRATAAWALGRMDQPELVPRLIDTLADPDPAVVDEARISLELIARKLEGFGPPNEATPDQKKEAARRWREWYEAMSATLAPAASPKP